MVTKVKSGVIGDNTVGITQLNVSDGSDGQVLTTNGSGTLSFSTVSGTTINSNANNRVITGSGTANTLEGETNFVYDGTDVGIGLSSPTTYYSTGVHIKGSASAAIKMTNGDTGDTNDDGVDLALDDSEEFRIINRENAGIALFTNATERMVIEAGGDVGIGTDNAACKLHLQNQASSDTTVLRLENKPSSAATNAVAMEFWGNEGTADNGVYNIAKIYGHFDGSNYSDCRLTFGTAVANGSFDDPLTIKYGKVGVGLSNPSAKFHSEGSFSGQIGYFNQTGTGGGNHGVYIDCASTSSWSFLARNGGSARFGLTGTEFRWFNGVTVQAGTSTSDKGSGIRNWAGSGYIGLSGDLTGYSAGTYSTLKANGPYIYFDISGSYSAYMASNGTINANSDRRLKENIITLSSGQLAKVCSLRGVNFDWIDGRMTGTQVGLIAQEVQAEYPELVDNGGIEDGTLTVNYAGLVSPLIEAIKELKTELDAAKARITTLEG